MYTLSRISHDFLLLAAVISLTTSSEESQAQPTPVTNRTVEVRQPGGNLTARIAVPLADHTILGNGIQDAFWSPDFNAIALSGQNNSIHSVISGSTPVALPAPPAAWSTEGDRLVLRTNTDSMLVWKVATRTTILSLVKSGAIATWDTPDNKVAAGPSIGGITTGGGITRVWSAITGQELFKLGSTNSQNFNDPNQQVAVNMATNPEWNSTGTRLLLIRTSGTTGAVTSNTGSSAEIYDAKSWTRLANILLTNPDQVKIAHFSPDDSKVVLAGSNVEIRNAGTGALIRKIDINNTINSAEWKPDGTQILTATHDAKYQIWNASTGSLVRTLEQATVSTSANHKAAFSPNGQKILTVIGNKVKVWKASDGTLLQTFDHGSAVRLARWRPSNDGILTIESTGSRAHTWKVN